MRKLLLTLALVFSFEVVAHAQLAPIPFVKLQYFDQNGNPCSGCRLYSYETGTETPLATYTTPVGNVANPNPLILDAAGRGNVYLLGQPYKIVLRSAANVVMWTVDPVTTEAVDSNCPGGTNTQVQFNDSGVCNGDSGLTFIKATDTLNIGSGGLTISGSSSGIVSLKTLAAAGTWTLTLPGTDGTVNQVLQTDGAGVTTWADVFAICGSNTQVFFNDSGACGADAGLTYVKASDALTVLGSVTTPTLKLTGSSSGTITVNGAAAAGTWTMTLPTTGGTSGYFLQTNGSGVTTWASAGGGGGTCPDGANTLVQFSDGTNCDSDADFTYVKSTNTALIGITTGGNPFTRLDDNKLDTFYTRGTATLNSQYGLDIIVSGISTLETLRGARVQAVHEISGAAPSSIQGLYVLADDQFSTSGSVASIEGARIEASTDSNSGTFDLIRGLYVRSLVDREGDGSANIYGIHIENHTATTSAQMQRVVGLIIDGNVNTHVTGLNEYNGIFVGDGGLTGPITETYGIRVDHQNTSTGTAGTAAGILIENQDRTALTVSYGLKIANQTSNATNYALYTGDGAVRFGDWVKLVKSGQTLIGVLASADFNVTTDQAIATICTGSYIIRRILVTNASTSLTAADGGIYPDPSKAGTPIVAATQIYTALTAAAKYLDLTLASITATDTYTDNPIYFSLTGAQGGAATADIYVYGECL